MKKLILLIAITASILSLSCDGVFDDLHDKINPGDQTDFYVAPDGNDNHPGWKAYPMATISRAMEKAAAGDRIHVMAGTYAGSVVLKGGVSLYGSYSNHNYNAASRNVIANPSIITATSTTGGIYESGAITQDIVVDSFEIQGVNGGTGNRNSVSIANTGTNAKITIQRCKIICGNSDYYSNGVCIENSTVSLINNILNTPSQTDTDTRAIYNISGNSTLRIINNTIEAAISSPDYWYGIIISDGSTGGTYDIINNIIVAAWANYLTVAIYQDTNPPIATISAIYNNNIIFKNTTDLILDGNNGHQVYQQGGSPVCETIEAMETLIPSVAHDNINADPLFVGSVSDFYQLQAASTSRDAGQNLYSQGITVDIAGNPRPETGSWSIGAYQYQE